MGKTGFGLNLIFFHLYRIFGTLWFIIIIIIVFFWVDGTVGYILILVGWKLE